MTAVGVVALVVAAYAGWGGLRRMRGGLRESESLELVRGIRGLITGVAAVVFGVALLTGKHGLLAFAAVFLAEELYETGVLVLIIRASREAAPARATP